MRKYDIPYVQNGPVSYYPVKDLNDMTLEEIKKKYIKMCAKANGDISVCSKCQAPCREGKRAIQLVANEIYNDPPIPLYGGKTLIEKAREENMRRRESKEKVTLSEYMEMVNKEEKTESKEVKEDVKEEKKKRKYVLWDGWWETSLESGDQVKWLVENMHLSKTQAKKKIYQYKWNHGMAGSAVDEKTNTVIKKEEKQEVKLVEKPVENTIETALEKLMAQQDKYKEKMDEYYKLYEEAKAEYEKIKHKTDILATAMDIIND